MPRAGSKGSQTLPVAKRLAEPRHERMLYALQRDLPRLSAARLAEIDSLNAAIGAQQAALEAAVEHVIAEVPIKDARERKLWRQVPAVRLKLPQLPAPRFSMGYAMHSATDPRGMPRKRPEVLEICDFAVTGRAWLWYALVLRTIRRASREPLTDPTQALDCGADWPEVFLFGNVYPAGCALGEVALHLSQVKEAAAVLEAERRADRALGDFRMQVLFVTDDAALYRALAPQAWGLCYEVDRLAAHNLDNLAAVLLSREREVDFDPSIS